MSVLSVGRLNRLNRLKWRKLKSRLFFVVLILMILLAMLPLFLVLGYVVSRGLPGLGIGFFTKLPTPTGIPGGMANAIVGTLEMVAVATAISLPVGVGTGLFLSEVGTGWLTPPIRFAADVLSGMPSIVIGLLAYAIVVVPTGSFSGFAGSVALAILMIPTIARASEQILRLVPTTLREAAFALGATTVQVWMRVLLPASRAGVLTALLLAVSRALGETAPLMFTAFGNQFWSNGLTKPTASLPLQVFVYALSPYPDWQQAAWTGALTLVVIALLINLVARMGRRTGSK